MKRLGLATAVVCLALGSCAKEEVAALPRAYVGFPETLDKNCRDGKARMFDQCGDQAALFGAALSRANSEGKALLVEYGTEWCIWCHVFEAHINGEHHNFRYTYGSPDKPEARYTATFDEGEGADAQQARALREFVAANFVIVHIDAEFAPNSDQVLDASGASAHFRGGIPFVFVVDKQGRYVAHFIHEAAEKRRDTEPDWYRGYNRENLMRQLSALLLAASTPQPPEPAQ